MNKTSITILVIVLAVIIGGVAYWYGTTGPTYSGTEYSNTNQVQPTSTTPDVNSTNPPAATTTSGVSAGVSVGVTTPPSPKSFSVNGNDLDADLKQITVAKGTPVSITFGADAQGTYHGGLDYRSDVVSTGAIAPGGKKTVSFTANNSFVFTPYWPSTNIKKPYVITVTVQ